MESAYYEDEHHSGISSRKALGRLLPLLRPYTRWLIICFLLLAASKGIYLLGPILIRRAIDVNIKGSDYNGLLVTVGLYILAQGAFLVINYLFRVRMEIIGQHVMTRLRKWLFEHIIKMAVAFFDRNPVGRLMARVESDTEALRRMFTNTVVAVIGAVLLLVGMFIWMMILAPRLAMVVAAFIPILTVVLYVYHRLTTPKWLVIRKRMADITATLTEFLQGVQIIQIFNQARQARRRLYDANRRKYNVQVKAEVTVVAMFNFIFLNETLILSAVVYTGYKMVTGNDPAAAGLTIGTLVMFISFIRMFFEPVHMMAEEIAAIQKAIAGAKRIFELLDTHEVIAEPVRPVSWPRLEEGIRFEDVWFSYSDDSNWAARDLNFEIPRGKRFALAGVTGGGKSTVINLLLRFNEPQKGRITVDGIDIRDIRAEELRAKIGLVLQDIFLFPGNVANNVSLSPNGFDRGKIVDACKMVAAHQFIERMPQGYETELSERGANLSRGERQLLSFARALVAQPEILILDEATSSVDPETERLIQEGMATLMRGRTSIVIAHRLSTILNVDQILVIRKGEIVERGAHAELMAQNGYYSKLFKLQFKQMNGTGVKKAC